MYGVGHKACVVHIVVELIGFYGIWSITLVDYSQLICKIVHSFPSISAISICRMNAKVI